MNRALICLPAILPVILLSAEIKVRVIQTTDQHGAFSGQRFVKNMELVRDATQSAGGIGSSIRIDSGDLIQGSYAMTFPEIRRTMFTVLNSSHYDVFIPGNHDFEFGLQNFVNAVQPFSGSVCAANLRVANFPLKSWTMLHRNGLKIAVIGLAYHSADHLIAGSEQKKIQSLPIRRQLSRIMPGIIAAKPEIIILAAHAGEFTRVDHQYTLADIVREYPQIDLVLSAHSHQPEPGKAIGRSWRIQAPALAQGIAVADFTYDTDKKRIISIKSKIIPISSKTPVHQETAKLLSPLQKKVFFKGRQKIGNIPFALSPLEKGEKYNDFTLLYGNAIIEATEAYGVFYSGSAKYRKNAGVLTEFDLYRLFPYNEQIGVIPLTETEYKAILDEQNKHLRKGFYQAQITGPKKTAPWPRKFAFSHYALSGAGGRFPVLRQIAAGKTKEYAALPLSDIVKKYIMKHYPVYPAKVQ